ncbi:MAG: hypothetical protein ABI591_24285 [Kofleriaceae bacterium]
MVLTRVALIVICCARVAAADSGATLREANSAATVGDWGRVQALIRPLLEPGQSAADLAEANRLEGLSLFFTTPPPHAYAEQFFVAYLKYDLEGRLDPALYPPEVVNFFNEVRQRHQAELVVLRPHAKRYWPLALLPPVAQFQNNDRVKGIVIGSALGVFLATNLTTYFVLRSWCHTTGNTCDTSGKNHYRSAETLSDVNVVSGIGLIATYAFGVWDGVRGYRRRSIETAPYVSSTSDSAMLGVMGAF